MSADQTTEGQSGKTFNVHKKFEIEPTQGPKKFQIESVSPSPEVKKLFRVEGEAGKAVRLPGTEREMLFTTQENGYDCGPCVSLNILNALGVETNLRSVSDVRSLSNQMRIAENERMRARSPRHALPDPTLPDNGWFSTNDIERVLRANGLEVTTWQVRTAEEQNNILRFINGLRQNGQEFSMYSPAGRHFRAAYETGDSDFLLDSLYETVQPAQRNLINGMIESAGQSDRLEAVGVAYRNSQTVATTAV